MRFFKTQAVPRAFQPPVPAPVRKPPVVEGWSESELVTVYNAAPVRHLKKTEVVFADASHTDSFFVLLEGGIQVVVKSDGHPGRPGIFRRGDCVAPLPKSPGLTYWSEAIEPATIIEITPTVLNHLPDKTQLSIYKAAVGSTSKINAHVRAVNGEMSSKNALLADYIITRMAEPIAARLFGGVHRPRAAETSLTADERGDVPER